MEVSNMKLPLYSESEIATLKTALAEAAAQRRHEAAKRGFSEDIVAHDCDVIRKRLENLHVAMFENSLPR
jgi:hypothetical protein